MCKNRFLLGDVAMLRAFSQHFLQLCMYTCLHYARMWSQDQERLLEFGFEIENCDLGLEISVSFWILVLQGSCKEVVCIAGLSVVHPVLVLHLKFID